MSKEWDEWDDKTAVSDARKPAGGPPRLGAPEMRGVVPQPQQPACHPEAVFVAKGLCKVCYYRHRYLVRTFGLTLQDYNALLDKQQGRCLICRNLPRKHKLHVDHDHYTQRVRGLLCLRCNAGLGAFEWKDEAIVNLVQFLLDIVKDRGEHPTRVERRAAKKIGRPRWTRGRGEGGINGETQ